MNENGLTTGADDVGLPRRFLLMGEFCFSETPCEISTVLGSCVTVTLFDPMSSIGAMNHGLLPNCKNHGKCNKDYAECFRFVECSFWAMLAAFEKKGIPRTRLQVKLFGGASMVTGDEQSTNPFRVGKRNVEAAFKVIEDARLNLVAYDFGGESSRQIRFRTDTGEVLLKRQGLPEHTLL